MVYNISLNYGKTQVGAVLPGNSIIQEINVKETPEITDIEQAVSKGLKNPIGSLPLADLARHAVNVVILISDPTRPLPSNLLLPPVLRELEAAGVTRNLITVIIGIGDHRAVTDNEKKKLLGDIHGQVKCFDSKETGYILMGITKRGTPVEVSAPIAGADIVIALGNIELHQLAGYSGGVKAVSAGAASKRALEHNHKLGMLQEDRLGILDNNIVRRDMEEFAQIANLSFVINVVLDHRHRVVSLVAGDPVEAHRKGCAAARKIFAVDVSEAVDIVITSPGGTPKDDTVYQAQKTLKNALRVTTDGGIVIIAAKCPEGFGNPVFEEWVNQSSAPGEMEKRINQEFVLGGHKGAFIDHAVKKAKVLWVSDMEPEQVRKMFFKPCGSLQEAVDLAISKFKGNPRIMVIPWGGLTVPFLKF